MSKGKYQLTVNIGGIQFLSSTVICDIVDNIITSAGALCRGERKLYSYVTTIEIMDTGVVGNQACGDGNGNFQIGNGIL